MALAAKDLRDKKPEELREELGRLKRESMNLRFQAATGQLNSTAEMRKARRDAARVKTILNEKARAEAQAAAKTAAEPAAEQTEQEGA